MTELRPVAAGERDDLRARLEPYLLELGGSPEYPRFDSYWSEPTRLPFWIAENGATVGFCLIRHLDGGWSVAEFSIDPDRRRAGSGRAAVDALVDAASASGASHIRADVLRSNPEGLAFWTSCGFVPVRSDDVYVTTIRPLEHLRTPS